MDTLGFLDSLNLYVYVLNSPLSFTDPSGQETVSNVNGGPFCSSTAAWFGIWIKPDKTQVAKWKGKGGVILMQKEERGSWDPCDTCNCNYGRKGSHNNVVAICYPIDVSENPMETSGTDKDAKDKSMQYISVFNFKSTPECTIGNMEAKAHWHMYMISDGKTLPKNVCKRLGFDVPIIKPSGKPGMGTEHSLGEIPGALPPGVVTEIGPLPGRTVKLQFEWVRCDDSNDSGSCSTSPATIPNGPNRHGK